MPKKNEEITVKISQFSSGGNGLAIIENGEVEVPFVMPGDTALVKLMRKRGGVWRALLQEVTEQAPDRIQPKCIHFSRCGGCRWQHIPYSKQLEMKELSLHELFQKFLNEFVVVHPIIPCEPEWNYRNKMEMTFSANVVQEGFLGLVLDTGRGRAFNLTECHLCSSWCVDAVKAVRTWWEETKLEAYYPPKNKGCLRSLTLREGVRTGDRMVILNVSGIPEYAPHKHHLESFVAALRAVIEPQEGKLSIFLRVQQSGKGIATNFFEMRLFGPEHIRERIYLQRKDGEEPIALTFKISPQAFFQPNTRQAEKLYSRALQMAQIPQDAVVYDLYCGTGTLGICAARWAKKVVSIELAPEAVLDARENAKENGIDNITIVQGDVGRELNRLRQEPDFVPPDVVLLDPPRVGLDPQAMECMLQLRPKKIVYISCNPKTQVVNIEQFVQNGYRLIAMQAVDQFPHTLHIENIVIMESL